MRWYNVLGIDPAAPAKVIKRTYWALAGRWHPDRNPGDVAAHARFQEIAEAYRVLGNPESRAAYDAELAVPRTVRELFERPAGQRVRDVFVPRAHRAPRLGQHRVVRLDGERLRAGARIRLQNGSVVGIPSTFWEIGIARIEGRGFEGANDAAAGDLFLVDVRLSRPAPSV